MTGAPSLLAALVAGTLLFSGCRNAAGNGGDPGGAAPAADHAGLETAAQLRRLPPLRDADVRLYAQVMHAAAERLDHPTPEDRRILALADELQRGEVGSDPARLAAQADVATRAAALRTHLDDEIVRERHIDRRWYELVRDRIESVIPPVDARAGGDAGADAPPPAATPQEAELRRLAAGREKADAALLAPHRAELQPLIRRVRLALPR